MWTVNDNPLSEGSGGKRVMGWAANIQFKRRVLREGRIKCFKHKNVASIPIQDGIDLIERNPMEYGRTDQLKAFC